MSKMISTHKLVLMALLIAAEVILSRFLSISLWNMKIGWAFVPLALSGILLGPFCTALVGGISDLIGAILFPVGTFFPGFTCTAMLNGFFYGYFLHKKQDMKNILLAVLCHQLIGSLLLNTFWLSLLYGAPFLSLLLPRLLQTAGMGIVQLITIRVLARYTPQMRRYA